ncbi:MAG: hypothetical protein PWP54_1408 [Thermosipho sp. (in: thermotogales)]|nr:hypothetical protein [Thermosipho sp. (in: thermotogales)]MDK2900137.1 hypothetical protein [Thermosipho sp. (in: thermotogales)]
MLQQIKVLYLTRIFDLEREDGITRRFKTTLYSLSRISNAIDCIVISPRKIENQEKLSFRTKIKEYNVENIVFYEIPLTDKIFSIAMIPFGYYYRSLYASKRLIEFIENSVDLAKYDIVFSNYFYVSALANKQCAGMNCLRIVDLVDAVSLHNKEAKGISLLRKLFYLLISSEVIKLEKEAVLSQDLLFITSDIEKNYLKDKLKISNEHINKIKVLGNYVDEELIDCGKTMFQKYLEKREDRSFKIAFIGAMDYYPNEQAVVRLINRIFSSVKEKFQNVELYLIGKNPTRKIQKIALRKGNVKLLGYVDDLCQTFRKIDMLVLPMRIASGVQNKLLTGLALGIPVVINSRAKFSTNLEHGYNVFFADNDQEYIQIVCTAIESYASLSEISKNANQFAREYLSKESIASAFTEAVLKALGRVR